MKRQPLYVLPEEATAKLERLVERIEAKPGAFVSPAEVLEAEARINAKAVVKTLPEGLAEDDLVGILKLAMLTECATETYVSVFEEGAQRHQAGWLHRFTNKVWAPDERTHFLPFKQILLSLGHSEEELDREIKQVRESHYSHCCGITPVELTTFGMMQEYLTDHWHGLIAGLLKPSSPEGARLSLAVKRRETLHYMWYRELTAIHIAANPDLIPLVAATANRFRMPGATLAPQFQSQVPRWMPHMGADFTHVARDIVRHFYVALGSTRRSGQMLLELAARRGQQFGPVSPGVLMALFNRLGGHGYAVLGEAALERVGLPLPQMRPHFYSVPYYRVRGAVRTFVASRIDLRSILGEYRPAAGATPA